MLPFFHSRRTLGVDYVLEIRLLDHTGNYRFQLDNKVKVDWFSNFAEEMLIDVFISQMSYIWKVFSVR